MKAITVDSSQGNPRIFRCPTLGATAVLAACAVMAAFSTSAQAPPHEVALVTDEVLRAGVLESGWPWCYHGGDNPTWARPEWDDSGWERGIDTNLKQPPASGWPGIGWFRLRLRLAPDQAGTTVAVRVRQSGASEIYLDGLRVGGWGTVGATAAEEVAFQTTQQLQPLALIPGREHLLAVRFSNHAGHDIFFGPGFQVVFREFSTATVARDRRTLSLSQEAAFVAGFAAAFAILHLLLFAFFPRTRANLYYALFTAILAALYWTDTRATFATDPVAMVHWFKGTTTFGAVLPICGILFAIHAFGSRIPRHFGLLVATTAAVVGWVWLRPGWPDQGPALVVTALAFLEMLRILALALYQRKQDVWIILAGFLMFLSIGILGGIFYNQEARLFISFGLLAFLTSVSIYLARGVARTEKDLEDRLVEVESLNAQTLAQERQAQQMETERRILEEKNRRHRRELEAARQLQLSMLPDERPAVPDLDVAFEMWTAAEVGGDYYDYRLNDAGHLTLAVGDATGHGLDAALVVVAAKSMFQTSGNDGEITELLGQLSHGIKKLGFQRMNMALLLARFKGHRLELSAAAMPPALHYQASTGTVAEVMLGAPPLGTLVGFHYRAIEIVLAPGDSVLLMTDGLPELVDPAGELLGYERTRELFAEVAAEPADRIVEHLLDAAREFSAERPREDDLTLVALRITA